MEELNKGDIAYAVKRFLTDAHQYAKHEEYQQIKRVMTTFMDYVEDYSSARLGRAFRVYIPPYARRTRIVRGTRRVHFAR